MSDYANVLRCDFASFVHRAFIELNPTARLAFGQYVELLASALEDCRRGITKRLIINIPPRYLKSHCATICFPAWLLGHDPSAQIICASYGQDLASKHALDTRKLMQSEWYQSIFSTRIADDKKAVDDFMTTRLGGRMATSVGGVLTGRGADYLIVDDPIKPDDALSESQRKAVIEWWDGTLLSRLNNKKEGCIILIMQRLHQDDLVGHVTEKDKGKWRVVSLPAIAEENEEHSYHTYFGWDTFKRREGEVLLEEREDKQMLLDARERLGEYTFSSQYQQSPVPKGGAIIKTKWLTHYDRVPESHEITRVVQSWDTAVKSGELNDFSVCTTWYVAGDKYYLIDVVRKRLDYPALRQAVIDEARRYNARTIVVEDKASGSQLIQELAAFNSLRIVPFKPAPGQDKIMRINAQSDLFERGKVLLPRQAPWLFDYVAELTAFPGSKFDDQVDSTAQALHHMREGSGALEKWIRLGENLPKFNSMLEGGLPYLLFR